MYFNFAPPSELILFLGTEEDFVKSSQQLHYAHNDNTYSRILPTVK